MATANTSHLLLTRIDHEAKMLNVMRTLFEDGHLTDVTLTCEGQLIQAHRLILSSVSNYFQTIFQNPLLKNQKNPVIVVKDMKISDLKAIIEFVYSGEVRICGDQLESLVKSAETLDISGLNKIDPNPVNHKESQSPSSNSNKSVDSRENSINSSYEKKSSTGKTNSHTSSHDNLPLQRKESGTNSSKTPCYKKSENINSSIRGTRSRPLEPTEGSSGLQGGRKTGNAQENITSSKNNNKNNNSTVDENKKRELRYISRLTLKERLVKEAKDPYPQNNNITNGNISSETKTLRDRRSSSSICEPISKVDKNTVNGKGSSDGDLPKNTNGSFKELTSDPKLSNISNKSSDFKKPLEPVKKTTKGNVLPEVYPSNEGEDYMKQFVCNKERLSMNLKRDDDVQSVSSITTRARRCKQNTNETESYVQNSPALPSRTVSPTPSNRSGSSTRTSNKRAPVKTSTANSQKQKQPVKKSEPVKTQTEVLATSRATRSARRGAAAAGWRVRAAKLKAAVATTRLSAKSKSNRVDWRAWFESQAKMLQNATGKQRNRREERAKQPDKSSSREDASENTNRTPSNTQSVKQTPSVSQIPHPFVRKTQDQEQNEQQHQQPQVYDNNPDNSPQYQQQSLTSGNTIQEFTNEFELEFEPTPKAKRKQSDSPPDVDLQKHESTSISTSHLPVLSSVATVTRNLRPKRAKTTSDSSDNPPSTSTANTSGSSLYTTASISPTPTSLINLSQQNLSDSNV